MSNRDLKRFYDDKAMRNSVQDYFNAIIDKEVLIAVYKGKDSKNYANAKSIVNSVFSTLDKELYPQKKKEVNRTRV